MKFYLSVLLSAMSFVSALCQRETFKDADSLMKQLSLATADSARLILKSKLAEAYRSNKPDTALLLANEALSGSQKISFKKGEVRSLIALCVLQREKGELPFALQLGLKAFKISEEEGYAYEEVYSLIRIANVYLNVGNMPKAIYYLQKSDEVLKINYDDFQWNVTQYFFGVAYEESGQLDAAERQVKMLQAKKLPDAIWIIINNRLLGDIALKRNEFMLAIKYYSKSNRAAIADTAYREAATAINAIAQVYKKLNQPDSAIFYAKEGLRLGELLSYKNRIVAASSLLAELYTEKDPKEAVKYYKIASATKDSLYGVQKVQQLQAATIEEQERQTALEESRIAYQNKIRQWSLLTGVVVFLVVAIILFRNNRQKHKANIDLQEQKQKVEITLHELKSTQQQLIQSEKMASLGELTAGIAHEIQNPLNFVNNFSEVNRELLFEMKDEISKGNLDDANVIADDIIGNEEKINHHGKRADAIVKGMLQHSRSSSATKEPTDINKLADEYLRLAYHGLRAKDKEFNAIVKTDFDDDVNTINMVPQDIGRVLLNLYNNAFYAVTEKKKSGIEKYEPTVTISTKKINSKNEVSVKDNGNGIPQQVLDKIFQPFFTTKPTGQGTGLGLSLSYDIIKAHGGEIKVSTKENEGTEFTILLPAND